MFRRYRDSVEVSWGRANCIGAPVDFDFVESSSGVMRLPPRDVAEPLHTVISEACEYLLSRVPNSERLTALRHSLMALPRNNQRQRRLMWLAGLGVDEPSVRIGWRRAKRWCSEMSEATLLRDSERSPLVIDGSCQAALMFGCVAPNIKREDALQLADAIVNLHSDSPRQDALGSNRVFIPIDDSDGPRGFTDTNWPKTFTNDSGANLPRAIMSTLNELSINWTLG